MSVGLTQVKLIVDPAFYVVGGLSLKIKRLQLTDCKTGFRFHDVKSCLPISDTRPHLTELRLRGWPALTFHPDSLHQTPNLQILALDIENTSPDDSHPWTLDDVKASVFFVREGEDEEDQAEQDENMTGQPIDSDLVGERPGRRPLWTWDWHLPHLFILALGPVFAHLFEFRMLESCPAVGNLELTLGAEADERQRVLSLQDFRRSVASSTSCCTHGADEDYASSLIVASSVQELTLVGPWIMDDGLRSVVFKTTFPNLERLGERFTKGYSTWEGWIQVLQRKDMPKLKDVSRWLNTMESNRDHEDGLTDAERIMKSHGMISKPTIMHNLIADRRSRRKPVSSLKKDGEEEGDKEEEITYYLNLRTWVLAREDLDASTAE